VTDRNRAITTSFVGYSRDNCPAAPTAGLFFVESKAVGRLVSIILDYNDPDFGG
jgi:hypothetical protein